jgi:hypothetical protein
MMITETGTVHYAGRFWLETTTVTEKNAYALIIRPMH